MTLQAHPIFSALTSTPAPTISASARTTCAHCALAVPPGLIDRSAENQFCCAGCRAVFESVNACGLGTYYRLRDAASATLSPATPGTSKFEAFNTTAFARIYVQAHEDGAVSTDLFLEGVTCAACIWLIEKLPAVLPGVIEARLALRRATVRVTWDPTKVSLSQIARTFDAFGYTPHPAKGLSREQMFRKEYRARLVKLGAAGAITGNLMLLAAGLYAGWWGGMEGSYAAMLRIISLILGVISLSWPGAEFFRSAYVAIRHRSINLDVPICIALATGGIAGISNVLLGRGEIYFDSLGALVFLLLIGRFFQFRQQRSAESAVELLYSMTPAICRVVEETGTTEIPIDALAPQMLVEVRPGEILPADGIVLSGSSTIDQALLTGESIPVSVAPGSEVFGGSQNGPSTLRYRVTLTGEHSRVGRLMQLLERGLTEKPDIVRFSDRVGVIFTFAVTILGLGMFAWWARTDLPAAIDHTVAFLIVTCPCVLGLATPMTLSVAIGQLAKRDILVKSGGALERLARGGHLLLDKTGTLTRGQMRVLEYSGDPRLRGLIARVEAHSNHPIAKALTQTFAQCEPPAGLRGPLTITERQNGGISATLSPLPHTVDSTVRVTGDSAAPRRRTPVSAQRAELWQGRLAPAPAASAASSTSPTPASISILIGSPAFLARHIIPIPAAPESTNTTIHIAIDGELLGTVTLGDQLRDDSAASVAQLQALGFTPQIWSGDAPPVVRHIARELSIPDTHAHGGASPEDKLAAVRNAAGTASTIMVGDGVNDAAALAAAGVGIAVHGGSEASLAAADIYIARPGLTPIVDLVTTARKTMRVIHRNFALSLTYNLIAGSLALTGHMNPLAAAIIMPLSAASVLSLAVAQMRHRP